MPLQDIFGWTVVHYMCLSHKTFEYFSSAFPESWKDKPFHEYFDSYHRSPIHIPVLSSNLGTLKSIMKDFDQETTRNAIAQPGVHGMTPLHIAATVGSSECTEELMKYDRNMIADSPDIWGRQASHIATKSGNTEVISKLLNTRVDVNRADAFGKSCLMYLLQPGSRALSNNTLLKFMTVAEDQTDHDGRTLFHVAAEIASVETFDALLQQTRPPVHQITTQDRYGRTPLILAVNVGQTEIARKLSNNSVRDKLADPYNATHDMVAITDKSQMTALHHALDNGMDELATHLVHASDYEKTKYLDGESVLVMACINDCVLSVREIIRKWPGLVNEADEDYGKTPLSWACESRNLKIVDCLFTCQDLKPNTVVECNANYTSLHVAVMSGDEDIVRFLALKENVDYGAKDDDGSTPLDLAVQEGNSEIIKILCTNRPNDKETIKALRNVSDIVFTDLIPSLLTSIRDETLHDDDLRAWINRCATLMYMSQGQAISAACLTKALDRSTWNELLGIPCHRAVQAGKYSTIRWMKENGADIEKLDADNWSWVDYGHRYGQSDTWKELEDFAKDLGISPSGTVAYVPTTFRIEADSKDVVELAGCQNVECGQSTCRLNSMYCPKKTEIHFG